MEQYITRHISQAEADGTLYKINWDLAQFPE
jgi:hypothetical protein